MRRVRRDTGNRHEGHLRLWIAARRVSGFALLAVLALASASGGVARAARVEVLLFGHPCSLDGPASISEAQLRAIHQISPEQTPLTEDRSVLRTSIERIAPGEELPTAFSGYCERRRARLEARLKFEEAVEKLRRTRDAEGFAAGTRGLIHARRHAPLVSKARAALKAGPSPRAWDELREYFVEFTGPDGEEDFHRTLRRLKIQYQCSFEGGRGDEEANGAGQAPEPAAAPAAPKH